MMMVLSAPLLMGGCPAGTTDALFKDVSRRPPDAAPATLDALKRDRPFGEWVLYQDVLCDQHGCAGE